MWKFAWVSQPRIGCEQEMITSKSQFWVHMKCSSPSLILIRQLCSEFDVDSTYIIILPKNSLNHTFVQKRRFCSGFERVIQSFFLLESTKWSITKNKTIALAEIKWRAKCCADFFSPFFVFHSRHVNEFIQISCVIPIIPSESSQGLGKTFCYLSMQFGFLLNSLRSGCYFHFSVYHCI